MGSGARAKTDAAGRWRFDSVPVSMSEVFVEINHPSFMPVRRPLTRGEFGIERGREPIGQDRSGSRPDGDRQGHRRSGKADRRGTGAHQVPQRHPRSEDGRLTAFTRLVGCEPRPARIVVSAKGRATDMKELNIEPGMGPVDFQMKPGGTVRIRVLDEQGNPVPKARIFFQRWRGPLPVLRVRPRQSIRRREWSLGVERSAAGRIQGGHLPPRRDAIATNNR